MLDLIKIDKQLRHYKAQIAGKRGRFNSIVRNAEWLAKIHGYPDPWWQDYDLHQLAIDLGHIGRQYLALKERIDEDASLR